MTPSRAPIATRREALSLTLRAGLAIAIVAVAVPSRAQAAKLAKAAVQYTDEGRVAGKDCDDCSQYVAPPTAKDPAGCRIVEGPISPHGHCIAFTPKA